MRASVARGFGRPPNRPSSSSLSNLPELATRLTEFQQRVKEARARGEDTTPKVEWGFDSFQPGRSETSTPARGRNRPWTSQKAKPMERVEENPPYDVTYWEAEGWFAVLIEGIRPTQNWRAHDDGISISVNGDVLRIVDTRNVMVGPQEGKLTPLGTKAAAIKEIIIPEEYEPNLRWASSWGSSDEVCQKGIGLLLKFPLK